MEKRSIDVRRMTDEAISALVDKYIKAGWEVHGMWELSVHQWITFIWHGEGTPPNVEQ